GFGPCSYLMFSAPDDVAGKCRSGRQGSSWPPSHFGGWPVDRCYLDERTTGIVGSNDPSTHGGRTGLTRGRCVPNYWLKDCRHHRHLHHRFGAIVGAAWTVSSSSLLTILSSLRINTSSL